MPLIGYLNKLGHFLSLPLWVFRQKSYGLNQGHGHFFLRETKTTYTESFVFIAHMFQTLLIKL